MKKSIVYLILISFITFGMLGCNEAYESIGIDKDSYNTGLGDPAEDVPPAQSIFKFANKTCTVKLANGKYIQADGESYKAGAEATTFYMKPATLKKHKVDEGEYNYTIQYILMDEEQHYLAAAGGKVYRTPLRTQNILWFLENPGKDNIFGLKSVVEEQYLAVNGNNLELLESATKMFGLRLNENCGVNLDKVAADFTFPEAEINIDFNGEPYDSSLSFSENNPMAKPTVTYDKDGNIIDAEPVIGYMDAHAHLNHNLGSGQANFVGENFNPLGIQEALSDCGAIHGPGGVYDIFGMALDGHVSHDTAGYPDFTFWPTAYTETHNQAYYRWIERSWLSGQRILVQQMVSNEILGEIKGYLPGGSLENPTNDMEICELQIKSMYEMQDYIDAQCGGPGKGWFRICTDSKQAREVISKGKLAVFLALEVDTIFGLEEDIKGIYGEDSPEWAAAKADILEQLNRFYNLGVRSIFMVHAFDNGFSASQLYQNTIMNLVNWVERGHWKSVGVSTNPRVTYQEGVIPVDNVELVDELDQLLGWMLPFGPGNVRGHANTKGLTESGRWLIDRMVEKGIMVEIDHMSDLALNETLDILEEKKYPGVIASHTRINDMYGEKGSWEQIDIPRMVRVMRLGGIISPMLWESLDEHQRCVVDHLELMVNGGGYFTADGPVFFDENNDYLDYNDIDAQILGKHVMTDDYYSRYIYYNYDDAITTTDKDGNKIVEVLPSMYDFNVDLPDNIVGVPYATDVNGACRLIDFEGYSSPYETHGTIYGDKVVTDRDDAAFEACALFNMTSIKEGGFDKENPYYEIANGSVWIDGQKVDTKGSLYPGIYEGETKAVIKPQVTGNRIFDIEDGEGMAHLGMMPDVIKKLQSQPKMFDQQALFQSAEAYLRMHERVEAYTKDGGDTIRQAWGAFVVDDSDPLYDPAFAQ